MKYSHIDIIEKCLYAYDKQRIADFISLVEKQGLTEHGFPRLAANIGTLMAEGRCLEYKDYFCRIMDLSCKWFPLVTDECDKAGNDFSIREVCWALMKLEGKGIVDEVLIQGWKTQIAALNPWQNYYKVVADVETPDYNWALFAAVSEYVRSSYCGIDNMDFVERQLANQLLAIDENGMYKDPHNPIMYDLVPRLLFMTLIIIGYDGIYRNTIEELLDKSSLLTLKMQSVTGEVPFGGRSIQFLQNEALMASLCELYAVFYKKRGDIAKAGLFKAAAKLAVENVCTYLNVEPVSHIKNRYPIDSLIGCEGYGYFNKYMITTASNIYFAYRFCDDSIEPIYDNTSYVASTSADFHKTFIRHGDYFLQYDTNADLNYDANGLGRVHKKGCPSAICLSVPFPKGEGYKIENPNSRAMSICLDDCAERPYKLVESNIDELGVHARFENCIGSEMCHVSGNGVDIEFSKSGFMLPVYEFDGQNHTDITILKDGIDVMYQGCTCSFKYDGVLSESFEYFNNRNGRYRVYKVAGNKLHVEISKG